MILQAALTEFRWLSALCNAVRRFVLTSAHLPAPLNGHLQKNHPAMFGPLNKKEIARCSFGRLHTIFRPCFMLNRGRYYTCSRSMWWFSKLRTSGKRAQHYCNIRQILTPLIDRSRPSIRQNVRSVLVHRLDCTFYPSMFPRDPLHNSGRSSSMQVDSLVVRQQKPTCTTLNMPI